VRYGKTPPNYVANIIYMYLLSRAIGIHGASFEVVSILGPVANSIYCDKHELDYFNLFVWLSVSVNGI